MECSVSGVSEHFWSIDRATNVAHSKLLMKTIKFLHNLSLWAFMTLWSSKKNKNLENISCVLLVEGVTAIYANYPVVIF